MRLKNRNAVITGSTSGIGLAYARAMAAKGVSVLINGLGEAEGIEKERAAIESEFGVRVVYSPADMTKPDHFKAMIGEAVADLGGMTPVDPPSLRRPVSPSFSKNEWIR